MKIYLETLTLTLLLLFIADTRITFSPFSITFGRGWMVLGIIMIMCGCLCLKYQWYGDGMKKGAEIYKETLKEHLSEELKKKL